MRIQMKQTMIKSRSETRNRALSATRVSETEKNASHHLMSASLKKSLDVDGASSTWLQQSDL
jgi:hypothetical protein